MRRYAVDDKLAGPTAPAERAPPTPGKATLAQQLTTRGLSRAEVEAMIAAALAGGAPLPSALAAQIARANGRTFLAHTGDAAATLARAAERPVVVVDDHVVCDTTVDPASSGGAATIGAIVMQSGEGDAAAAVEPLDGATAAIGPAGEATAAVEPGTSAAIGGGTSTDHAARSQPSMPGQARARGRTSAKPLDPGAARDRKGLKAPASRGSRSSATTAPTATAAPAPSAPATATATAAPQDTLVEAWMEGHFSDQRLHQLATTIGTLPAAPSAVSPIDRAIPVAITDPMVRGGIELLAGIGLGMFDGVFWSVLKSLPMMGPAFAVIDGIRDGLETGQAFADAGAPLGGVIAEVRIVVDVAKSIIGNIGGWIDIGSGVVWSVGVGSAALGMLVGLAAPPIGVAIEGFAASCMVVYAGLSGGQAIFSAASSALGQAMVVMDAVLFVHDAVLAHRAEAAGDFERAGKLKALMQGSALDLVTDGIGALIDGAAAGFALWNLPGVDKLAKGGVDFLIDHTVDKVGDVLDGDLMKKIGGLLALRRTFDPGRFFDGLNPSVPPIGPGIEDPLRGGVDGVRGDPIQDLFNLVPMVGGVTLGDEMRTSAPYIDTSRAAPASGPIGQARRGTVDSILTTWNALGTQPIDWFQGLVDEILRGPPGTNAGAVAGMMQPSHWILLAVEGLANFINASGGAGSAQAVAAGATTVGGWIGMAQPVLDGASVFIQQAKPRLDTLVADVAAQIGKTRISLDGLRGGLAQVETASAQIGGVLDQQAQMTTLHHQLDATLAGIKLDRASLGLPDAIPVPGADAQLDAMLDQIHAPVTVLRGMIAQLKATAIDPMQAKILAVRAEVDGQLAMLHEELAAGGVVEQDLVAVEAKVKQTVADAAVAFAQWSGKIPIDLAQVGAALTELGASATAAAQVEMQTPAPATAATTEDPWRVAARTEGQPFIDSWTGAHEVQLRTIYQPVVAESEIVACQAAHDAALARGGDRFAPLLASRLARCLAYRGATGRDAIYGLWAAEDELLRAIALVNDPPPVPTPVHGQP
jgi:hypothetical protein